MKNFTINLALKSVCPGMLCLFFVLLSSGPHAESQVPTFQNEPGWTWLVSPIHTRIQNWVLHEVMGITGRDASGALTLTLVWRPEARAAYQAVAFDGKGNRFVAKARVELGSSGSKVSLYRWIPSVLPADQIEYLGFEKLSAESWVTLAKTAQREAAQAGIQVVPFPEIGKPYEFSLMGAQSTPISAKMYEGKTVLLDCWATWCSPCMKKMPGLKKLYEAWRNKGLVVIGINFDHTWEAAEAAIGKSELPWPQVYVPADQTVRDFWYRSSSIKTLPAFLIIDRRGTLREFTNDPAAMETKLLELLAE